jgi:hypothetical protein
MCRGVYIYLVVSGTCRVIYTLLKPKSVYLLELTGLELARIPRDRWDFQTKTISAGVTYTMTEPQIWVVLWITDRFVLEDTGSGGRVAGIADACSRGSGLKPWPGDRPVLTDARLQLSWGPADKFRHKLRYPWFQASAAMLMRFALFWGITQRRVLILYRRFGTTYRSRLQRSRSLHWRFGTTCWANL